MSNRQIKKTSWAELWETDREDEEEFYEHCTKWQNAGHQRPVNRENA